MEKGKEKNKFNWKLVLISWIVIALVYVIVSGIMIQFNQNPRTAVYCWFNTTIHDDVPRDQCGIIKIISGDLDEIGIHQFEKFGKCSESLDEIPKCEGQTYHFAKYRLKDLCEGKDCNTDGVICNAYFITYHNESDPDRMNLEGSYFSKPNLESEKSLMEEFNKCNAGGLPWQ